MKIKWAFPTPKESILAIAILSAFLVLTAIFVGLRPEHIFLTVLICLLFFTHTDSRKLVVGLLPFVIFGISYDWMRVYPNYLVNSIDIEHLYNLEKLLFGFIDNGLLLIPSEYFALHSHSALDFLAGIFYLGWVPIPVAFGLYLYLKKQKNLFLRFSMVFLFVNLIGFACYYVHPAAPPWYAMNYGFEPILDTPGNMAGLARFDDLTGLGLFHSIYGRNANVFAALPSLHSAYLVIVMFYALKNKCNFLTLSIIFLFMCGIWATAVYTAHHYIIDVIAGILCALTGILLFEYGLLKLPFFKRFFLRYLDYITQ
jgi:hypothetical protein